MLAALPLPFGDLGTYLTLAQMRRMVYADYLKPDVRLTAARIASNAGSRDGLAQAVALRDWIEDHTQFLRDPDGAELLHGPAWQIRRILTDGYVPLDCDDVAILAAAMGKAVGLRARFIVVGFLSPNAPFRHVWTELASPAAPQRWIEVDVTRPAQGLPFDAMTRILRIGV